MSAGSRSVRLATAVHRAVRAVLLPAPFRARNGAAMTSAFEEAAREARQAGGRRAVVLLLLREMLDLPVAAVRVRSRPAAPVQRAARRRRVGALGKSDVVQAVRVWRKSPGFTVAALATLALGVGASTSIWTLADGVLLRPLPHEDPAELVQVYGTSRELPGARLPISYPNFVDLRAGATGLEDMAVYGWPQPATVVLREEAQSLRTVAASGHVFELLGNAAALGRTFTPADAEPGSSDVVVISDAVWRTHMGASADVVGSTIRMDGRAVQVIGVMPRTFTFPWAVVDLWVPMRESAVIDDRDTNYLSAIGRLAEGVTIEAARPRIEAAMGRVVEAYPTDNAGKGVVITPRRDIVVGDAGPVMRVLLGASLLLLLLACANLANLMLARGAVRRRELAVRAALGAGRRRLVSQLVLETGLLAVAGGVLGVVAARFIVGVLLALAPPSLPRRAEILVDERALAFAALATVLSGVLFGLLPALRAASADPAGALREGGRGLAGGRHRGLRGLVVAQLALALVLVAGGGLLLHSFSRLLAVDPGFDPDGIWSFRLSPPEERYTDITRVHAFYDAVLGELEALPGVVSAGATWALPFTPAFASGRITVEGRPLPEGSEPTIGIVPVRGDYFRAMDLDLRAGRWLDPAVDVAGAPPVVLINEAAARRFWPGEDAVGKRLRRGRANENDLPWITVVGVVEDAKRGSLASDVDPELYWNHEQAGAWAREMTIVARAARDPAALARPVRDIVRRIDPSLAVTDAMLLTEHIDRSVAEPRFRTLLLSAFSALALLLAVIGTYGVMAFVVANRRHEIGVRMALGADDGRVLRSVLRDGMRLVLVAVVLGLAGAAAASRALANLLFGVEPLDPLSYGGAAALLIAAALLACWLPARRASRVDPLETLRDA